MKRIVLNLTAKTSSPELSCPDGEVEAYMNVPWLEEEEKSGGAKPGKEETVVSWTLGSDPVDGYVSPFPAGSRLLCIHRPIGEETDPIAIIRQADSAIACRRFGSSGQPVRIGTLPRSIGTVRGFYPWRDVVTVVGSNGVCWLLYQPSAVTYSLLPSLPEAPEVTFASDDANLEGYTPIAGADPEMDVEVDLHDLQDVAVADAIADWLGNGQGLRVDQVVKQRVFDAVGRRIGIYEDDVRQAGMVLAPVAAIAFLGMALPSEKTVMDCGYSAPSAKLLSWTLSGATLSLRVAFSLRPQRLSATFTLTTLQLAWRRVFGSLDFCLTDSPRWWIPDPAERLPRPVVTALTSLRSEDSGGFAFRFRCRSKAALIAEARDSAAYRRSLRIDLGSVSQGVTLLPLPSSDSPLIVPDYTDFEPIVPDGAALTEDGVAIWNGRSLMVPMKENGVVYRHRKALSDSPILAAARSLARAKGDEENGRHTLLLFCRDGIRQIEADGDGGYRTVRFLAGMTVDSSAPSGQSIDCVCRIAVNGSATMFLSQYGLASLSSSGSLKLLARYPDGVSGCDVLSFLIDSSSPAAVMRLSDGTMRIWSFQDEEWYEPAGTMEGLTDIPLPHEGRILMLDAGGHLVRINSERTENLDSSGSSARMARSLPGALPPMSGKCGILTRPLKFGMPFCRKRIAAISTAIPAAFRIEGSDNLVSWRLLAEGTAPRRGLHTVGCRYLRVRLIADVDSAGLLSRIGLSVSGY